MRRRRALAFVDRLTCAGLPSGLTSHAYYRPPGRATLSVSTLTEKNIVEDVSREHQAVPKGSVLKQPNAGAQLPARKERGHGRRHNTTAP
jgi:hypothetical protein